MVKRNYYPAIKILKLRNLITDYYAQDLIQGKRSFGVDYGEA